MQCNVYVMSQLHCWRKIVTLILRYCWCLLAMTIHRWKIVRLPKYILKIKYKLWMYWICIINYKLNCYSIGTNVKNLIDRPDGIYCFREKKDRVYYTSEKILNLANTVGPDHLLSLGTCFGKFTKSGKFKLHVTALHYLAPYAQVSISF